MALFMPPVTGNTLKRLNRAKTRYMIDAFGGINYTLRPSENQYTDGKDMSSDKFPVLAPRQPRAWKTGSNFQGALAKDALAYVDNNQFYYNGSLKNEVILTQQGEKTLVSFGAWILIFPEKIMYNTVTGDVEYMEKTFTATQNITYSLARVDGQELQNVVYSATEPENPANGKYWVDTSAVPNVLKQWSSNTSMWVEISSTYIRIETAGIDDLFNEGDGVTISGSIVSDLNNTMVVWQKGSVTEEVNGANVTRDYIVVAGILNNIIEQDVQEQGAIVVKKNLPDMDFCIEANNRLWGCKYGTVNGQTVNQIYASKLGDPTNFGVFMGTAADSYAVSLGSDGVFTGAANYLGYPIFFKENCIHKVYGQYPANFQVQTTKARGVQRGSSKSIALVDERLYYKSTVDICVYDGSLPQSVSEDLGSKMFYNAVAGALGKKYYVWMKENTSVSYGALYVLDTSNGIWHKENFSRALQFTRLDDELIGIGGGSSGNYTQLYSMTGKLNGTLGFTNYEGYNSPTGWFVWTGPIGYQMPDKKYPSRITIRAKVPINCSMTVSIGYDDGVAMNPNTITGNSKNEIVAFSVVPKRCHHFKLYISGSGPCEIYSITKTMQQGSDR